ncbi:MAG: hypothetical protein GWP37_04670 [Gammaproteobacteria bacterium]|nr:hypothetical protein [Gammaproteobacteria bacterium]
MSIGAVAVYAHLKFLPPKAFAKGKAWIIDSGANRHCVPNRDALTTIQCAKPPLYIKTANGAIITAEYIGTIERKIKTLDGLRRLRLTGVLVVPGLVSPLFSVKYGYTVDGISTHFNDICQMNLPDGSRISLSLGSEHYLVDLSPYGGELCDTAKDFGYNIHPNSEICPYITAFMLGATEYDPRKYTLCGPHNGEKGLAFKTFADNFLTNIALAQIKDTAEFYDLAETIAGVDEGGPNIPPGAANPIAMPAAGAALASATRRRTKRLKLAYVYIYQHVTNEPLRRMLIAEAYNNGYLAWQVLVRECDEPITQLELEDLKQNVREQKILDTVGYTDFSVSKFRRNLVIENTKIPDPNDQLSEDELCLILLRGISRCSNVFVIPCSIELKAVPAQRTLVYPGGHPQAGQRSLSAIVAHFEPLWKSAIQLGSIPLRAPTSSSGPGTSRVDGMLANASALAANTSTLCMDSMIAGAHAAATTRKLPDASKRSSVICWNCKGIGHFMNECPSPKIERSYTEVISLLASYIEKQLPLLTEKEPKPDPPGHTEQAQFVGFVDVHNQNGHNTAAENDSNDNDLTMPITAITTQL